MGGARIRSLCIGKVDRADREHLHGVADTFRWHHDHRSDAPIGREGETVDRLFIGDDLVSAGGQQSLDAANAERMPERCGFSP
jgi:hypothetical protein